ncbi:heavy metal sensor histidine kinase [Methylotenera sp.]|uniref:heavy metal sensor histidine kinase n=1 Tax=Methylotenera sp. TaxID=2051956 RepID=UPI0027371390|nr:heavy metal sensor histidine kinase [Methylotenera sp.]MDP3211575.1 heavy metal sensor histidine kinase [Methylotenera sp.]
MINPRSITFRLTLLFSTASATTLLLVGLLVSSLVESHFEEQDLIELRGKLELIRHAFAKVRTPSELTNIPNSLSDALIGHPDLSVVIRGPDNRLLFTTSNATFATYLFEQPSNGDVYSNETKLVMWEQREHIYRGISATTATGITGQPMATAALAVNIEHHTAFMKSFHTNLWMAIATGILLTIVLGWGAARRGLAPVREMANVAKGISVNRLSDRLSSNSVPPELTNLAIAFNEMLTRLEGSFHRLSDFSSDLAHELRTPISNLMTQTQVALSKGRSIEEYREVLYSNLEEYERLARMISDMLFLAKADNGLIVPNSEIVNLHNEVRDLFGFYEAIADEQSVSLKLIGEGTVRGDRLMLRRALSNLLSNAIRHSSYSKLVKVLIDQTNPEEITLVVENYGETIAMGHLPRLFDRFYRVDPSRQKTSDGAGLGLAIAKSIIEAHKGKINAFSSNGITRFEITFPSVLNE